MKNKGQFSDEENHMRYEQRMFVPSGNKPDETFSPDQDERETNDEFAFLKEGKGAKSTTKQTIGWN